MQMCTTCSPVYAQYNWCISVTGCDCQQTAGVIGVLHSSTFSLQGTLLVCCVYMSVYKCLCRSIRKSVCVCVRACVRVCMRAYMRACMRACLWCVLTVPLYNLLYIPVSYCTDILTLVWSYYWLATLTHWGVMCILSLNGIKSIPLEHQCDGFPPQCRVTWQWLLWNWMEWSKLWLGALNLGGFCLTATGWWVELQS